MIFPLNLPKKSPRERWISSQIQKEDEMAPRITAMDRDGRDHLLDDPNGFLQPQNNPVRKGILLLQLFQGPPHCQRATFSSMEKNGSAPYAPVGHQSESGELG